MPKITIEKHVKGIHGNSISFLDDDTYLVSSTGSATLCTNDKLKKELSLPGFIDGKFAGNLSSVSSGIVEVNLKSGKTDYNRRHVSALVAAANPHCRGWEDHFEVSYAYPVPEHDRLVLSLRYRPTRIPNRKDPEPHPKDVIGLLKLSQAEVISVLDSGMLFISKPILKGTELYYGCDGLKLWDVRSGEQLADFCFFRLNTFCEFDSGVLVFTNDGDVWNALPNGSTKRLKVLEFEVGKTIYLPKQQAVLVSDNTKKLHLISCANNGFEDIQQLELENEVDGFFAHPDGKHVYLPMYISDYMLKIKIE